MSAFTLDGDHIDLLVTAAMRIAGFVPQYVNVPEAGDRLGRDLLKENYDSVNYRYSEEEPVPEYSWTLVELPEELEVGHLLQIYLAARCYSYQTCEHPEWHHSRAYWACQAITEWAERQLAARRWPKDAGFAGEEDYRGLDDVKWEWSRADGFPRLGGARGATQ